MAILNPKHILNRRQGAMHKKATFCLRDAFALLTFCYAVDIV